MMTDFEKRIMEFNSNPENIAMREYYDADNIWKTLKIEREENRHSAFLAWVLGLNVSNAFSPIYRLLALLASKAKNNNSIVQMQDELKKAILYETIKITGSIVSTEKCISDLSRIQYKDRIDIYADCIIEGMNDYNRLEIIIENKVNSDESGKKTKKEIVKNPTQEDGEYAEKNQTERYYYACSKDNNLRNNNFDPTKTLQLFVFLSPKEDAPKDNHFIKLSYQDILDYILEPYMKTPKVETGVKSTIYEYMRNLGNPDNKYKLILANMNEEKELAKKFFDRNVDLYQKALNILKGCAETEEEKEMYENEEKQIKSIVSSRKNRSYTINGEGNHTMYDVLAKFVKWRLEQNDKIGDIEEFIKNATNERRTHISNKKEEVFRHDKHVLQVTDNIFLTKEWGGSPKEENGTKDSNFVRFYKKVNEQYPNFTIDAI